MRFGHRPVPPPESHPLEEVFEAERAAAAAIAAAKHEAEAWLVAEKGAIEQDCGAALASLDAGHADNVEHARQVAAAQADAIVAAAEADARDLQSISDEELLPIVARHTAAILPGGAT